jgi:hypothetical protein
MPFSANKREGEMTEKYEGSATDVFAVLNCLIRKMSDKFELSNLQAVGSSSGTEKLLATYEMDGIINAIKSELDFVIKAYASFIRDAETKKTLEEIAKKYGVTTTEISDPQDIADLLYGKSETKKPPKGDLN